MRQDCKHDNVQKLKNPTFSIFTCHSSYEKMHSHLTSKKGSETGFRQTT